MSFNNYTVVIYFRPKIVSNNVLYFLTKILRWFSTNKKIFINSKRLNVDFAWGMLLVFHQKKGENEKSCLKKKRKKLSFENIETFKKNFFLRILLISTFKKQFQKFEKHDRWDLLVINFVLLKNYCRKAGSKQLNS